MIIVMTEVGAHIMGKQMTQESKCEPVLLKAILPMGWDVSYEASKKGLAIYGPQAESVTLNQSRCLFLSGL